MNEIIKKIYRAKDIENIENKINMLGSDRKLKFNAVEFLTTRIITTLILALILILSSYNYILIPFILIIYYNLFYYVLITNEINKRIKKLDSDALYFFEILTLTLETGKNLENSLEITCSNVDNDLSSEFKKSLLEMRFGKSLKEALIGLKKRIPSDTINNIILNMLETNIFGNSIIDTMNNQVEYLREKELMDLKATINKIPNKVSIISVLFIVPLILLIVLGPFLIDLL